MADSVKPPFAFEEYHSINVTKARKLKNSNEVDCVVLEKVHGSNFCIYASSDQISCARRTGMLEPHETFYNFQLVRDRYGDGCKKIFETVKASLDPTVKNIGVFGELFGGIYPHEETKDLGFLHVQKGVYYTNQIEFYAFDIWVVPAAGTGFWLNYDTAMSLFEKFGFFYAKPLFRGPLSECVQFTYAINSTIPALLGLPTLAKNQMEGIIVKAVDPTILNAQKNRLILKLKNPKFEEVNPPVAKTVYETIRDTKDRNLEVAYDEIGRYINENRFNSVRSKLGEITVDRINEAADFMSEDAFKDFLKDQETLWTTLDPDVQERFKTNTRSKVGTFVTQYVHNNTK